MLFDLTLMHALDLLLCR